MKTKFTIFTSCYNQAAYLSEAIESVLNQTYTDFEYLLYDDGSTDNTWEIIQSYAAKDSRIKAVKLDKQKNVACVLNVSIRDMSTDFWLWCPSDDVWCDNLLEVKAQYAVEHPDKVVYSNFTKINEKGSEIGRTTITPRTPDEFRLAVESSSPIGFTGILIPKSVFDLVGPFPEDFWFSEDFYWMYKAATFDKADFIGDDRFLYYKRIHKNRLTGRRLSGELDLQANLARSRVKGLHETKIYQAGSQVVPKKIFFYWGNPVMSWLRYMTLYSFRKFNPDWEMELHVSHIERRDKYWSENNEQDFHSYKGKNYLPEVEKLGVKIKECPVFVKNAGPSHNSNLFKWNELATNGGIYSDMDILFVEPIEEYYNKIQNLQTGISYSADKVVPGHGGYYSIGFMFSAGNNRFFKDLFDWTIKHCNLNSYQGAGVGSLYSMLEAGQGMRPYHNGLSYIPMGLVYPWRDSQQKDFFNYCHTTLPKETIGIHWYAGHPMAQKFNNSVSEQTLSEYSNTMSFFLNKTLRE